MNNIKKGRKLVVLTALPYETKIILSTTKNLLIKSEDSYRQFLLPDVGDLLEIGMGVETDQKSLIAILEISNPDIVVNIGICGSLSKTHSIGDTFLIDKICRIGKSDKIKHIVLSPVLDILPYQFLLTVENPILDTAERNSLFKKSDCKLVDMEAFKLAKLCKLLNLPLLVIKTISDYANEQSKEDFKQNSSLIRSRLSKSFILLRKKLLL